jgi:hypothetical protein
MNARSGAIEQRLARSGIPSRAPRRRATRAGARPRSKAVRSAARLVEGGPGNKPRVAGRARFGRGDAIGGLITACRGKPEGARTRSFPTPTPRNLSVGPRTRAITRVATTPLTPKGGGTDSHRNPSWEEEIDRMSPSSHRIESAKNSLGTDDRPLPERLYKYLAPERLDILEHGRIRFTQPEAFNDPFEFLPALPQLRESGDDVFVRRLFDSLAGSLSGKIQSAIGTQVGILSLADDPLHLLMWAHYARSHEGFAIELNTNHPFFNQTGGVEGSCMHLRPVRYSHLRPSLDAGTEMIDMYYTKSDCWGYEGEWRLVLPLRECPTKIGEPGSEIFLFDLPREAITAVIVGSRASKALTSDISELIRRTPELRLARLQKVNPDPHEYRLALRDVRLS